MILIRPADLPVAGAVSQGVGHLGQGVATRLGHHPVLASIAIAVVAMLSVREVRPHAQPKRPPWAELGGSVAAGPGFLFVAANPQKDGKGGPGAVHVFQRSGSAWIEARVLSTPEATVQDIFGVPMATDGQTLVVGAPAHSGAGRLAGAAYVFERQAGA